MKRLVAAVLLLSAAACSKAPDSGEVPDLAGNATAGVAFIYGYAFELPSRAIAELQEAHAQACERVGTASCRITGLTYNVDRDGNANASLSVKVASRIARRFGREAVVTAERGGATLVGAEISGEEAAPEASASATQVAQADVATLDRQLADPKLSPAERAELRAQRSQQVAAARASAADASAARERIATTPMTFSYRAGHGVGFGNALRDTADTALSSSRLTLIGATWLLAALGPPALLLLLLWFVWRRWARHWWERVFGAPTP
jgi:hypothetical protein